MRKLLIAALAALAFVAGSLDVEFGDLRYSVAGKTVRHWSIVPTSIELKPACAAGFIRSGGAPCGGAGTYTLAGSASGKIGQSSSYTVTPVGTLSSSVVVTPNDSTHHGIFAPTTVTMSGSTGQSFNYEPLQVGTYNLATTNGGGLTNPSPISFAVTNFVSGYPSFTTWGGSNSSATTGQADPFGGTAAILNNENSTNNYHTLASPGETYVAGQTYHFSIFVKQGSGSARNLDVGPFAGDSSAAVVVIVNPSTCSVLSAGGWGTTVANATASTAGLAAGWCLLQFDFTVPFTAGFVQTFLDTGSTGPITYLGDGASGVFLYGASIQ